MPQPRKAPLFELAGQWIGRDPSSPNLYRFWTEPGTGRTRRASLGTGDFERAKEVFARAVLLEGPKTPDTPLAAVLTAYFVGRTDKLPSAKHARLAGRTLLECFGTTVRVSQVTEEKQRHFAEWSMAKGHSLSYISRNLSVLAASVRFAKLSAGVFFGKRQIKERWALQTKAARRAYIPTDDELVRFFRSDIPPALFRWAVMASLTGGRPEAVLELTPAQRIRDAGLIDLNPAGRSQNKKYRATVREPKALKAWLDRWERGMRIAKGKREMRLPKDVDISGERYCEYASVDSLQTAMQRAKERLGFPISVYSFRHKHATVLRKARVSEDIIALDLGHKQPGLTVTAGYGEWSPDYLKPAASAIEAWWTKMNRKAKDRLNSRATPERVSVEKVRNSHLRPKNHLRLVS